MLRVSISILLALALVLPGPGRAAAQAPIVSVERLANDVYLFTYDTHRSLFIVSTDGVLATDPQSATAAARYRAEIRKITPVPIRYIVYSHHHDDHVSGARQLDETAAIVAHANVLRHLPAWTGGPIAAPDVTFTDAMSLFLGELEVRLVYPGPSETDSNIILYVPARRLAFMVDAVLVRGLPWRDMASGHPDTWIAALERLRSLEFDLLAPGHGPTGTRADVQAFIDYLTTLCEAVRTRVAQGQTLEQIQASLRLPQYASWERYDEHFALNIAGVYRELTRVER